MCVYVYVLTPSNILLCWRTGGLCTRYKVYRRFTSSPSLLLPLLFLHQRICLYVRVYACVCMYVYKYIKSKRVYKAFIVGPFNHGLCRVRVSCLCLLLFKRIMDSISSSLSWSPVMWENPVTYNVSLFV